MNLIDKILIAILVILLPVGILLSRYILTNDISPNEELVIDAKKLKAMINEFERIDKETNALSKDFVMSSVSYATESGSLIVKGTAPSSSMNVMMSATVLPSKDLEEEDGVLGSIVENYSILVKRDGSFLINLPIENSQNIVEIRLEQEEVVRTIRYDLNKKIQTL